jgi:hypothetical protein
MQPHNIIQMLYALNLVKVFLQAINHFNPTYRGSSALQSLGIEPQKGATWHSVKLGKQ